MTLYIIKGNRHNSQMQQNFVVFLKYEAYSDSKYRFPVKKIE